MNTKHQIKRLGWIFGLFFLLGAYVLWSVIQPLPVIKPSYNPAIETKPIAPDLIWPAKGQAAVSIAGTNISDTHGAQTPAPTASTAKVITALMILQKKPLRLGQPGPTITITAADVAIYNQYIARDGSVLPVQVGEQLSEYQALEAMMLPSANNIADTTADWAYGSLNLYANAANAYLHSLGLKNTRVGSDASGLTPDTVTTAQDLVTIGKIALTQPVLSQIVSQNAATGLPLVPVIKNVNYLLGQDGIIGIKTGNSDPAGGVFLGAAKTNVNGKPLTLVTAVVGESSLSTAMLSSKLLIQSAENNFQPTVVIKKGDVLGTYTAPWGEKHSVIAAQAIGVDGWHGEKIAASISLHAVSPTQTQAGTIMVQATTSSPRATYSLKLDHPFTKPSLEWRLTHPVI